MFISSCLVCNKRPTVQMPSRLNLCGIQTAGEPPRPDQTQPGGRPQSGFPAKQIHVSPTLLLSFTILKLWQFSGVLHDTQFFFRQHLVLLNYAKESFVFSVSDNFQDKPPPLPSQKPVGDLGRQVSDRQVRFSSVFFACFKLRSVLGFLKLAKFSHT